MMLTASPPRRPFEALPKHALPDSPFDDPFAVTVQPRVDVKMTFLRARMAAQRRSLRGVWKRLVDFINENRLQLLLSVLVGLFGIIMMLVIAYTFFLGGHTAQPLAAPVPTFAPIVSVTPNVIQTTITPDTLNAAMKPDSQTVVTSIEPLPQTQAALDRQIVITNGLIGAGFFGWYDDRKEGDLSYSCSDRLCGPYQPNQITYLCGGWVGINTNQLAPALDVIKSVHLCVEAQRVPASDRSAASIGLLSQSARRLLVGDTVLWPLLYIEIYTRAPYPIAALGK